MMKKINLILLIIFCAALPAYPQEILTLKECYDMAMAASPLSSEKENYSEISRLRDANLAKNLLPTIDAGGSILYNSSVIDMRNILGEIPVPGIEDLIKPLPHEQYKITLDINQVIYDGGAVKNARMLEKADMGVNLKQSETDLYKLRSQINSCYFGILLSDHQKVLLGNYIELLEKRLASMMSALNNDMIIRSDIDLLESEKIKLGQQLKENEILRSSLVKILSSLTGTDIGQSVELAVPFITSSPITDITRPELDLLELRKEQLNAGLKAVESKRMPKAFGFATLGYGNPPGNNFFKDEFAPYFVVGASLKWNIFDWNKAKTEKQAISLQQGIIEGRKSDLNEAIRRQLETKSAEIENLESLVKSDDDLIKLRKKITASSISQYENGTITAAELLGQINSEKQAVVSNEIHKITLSMARVEYLYISGKEIE